MSKIPEWYERVQFKVRLQSEFDALSGKKRATK